MLKDNKTTEQKTHTVVITRKKDGAVRVSTPVSTYVAPSAPPEARDSVKESGQPPSPNAQRDESARYGATDTLTARELTSTEAGTSSGQATQQAEPPGNADAREVETTPPTVKLHNTKKLDPDSLEELIAYGYSRKGQKIRLKQKVAEKISSKSNLSAQALERLLGATSADRALAVPRQLLLTARSLDGLQTLRTALVSFVKEVMLRNPIFKPEILRTAIEEPNPSISMYGALQAILNFQPAIEGAQGEDAEVDLRNLRTNALNLFVVWMFHVKHYRIDELVAALHQTVWLPAAQTLDDDTERIKALTEASETAALGWIAERLRKSAAEANDNLQRALNEVTTSRNELEKSRQEVLMVTSRASELEALLKRLEADTSAQLLELEQRRTAERTQLNHELDHLKGRLVERLDECAAMLKTGLAALGQETPRVEVMLQRAEAVIEKISNEIRHLRGE
jgi:hypothetical protein